MKPIYDLEVPPPLSAAGVKRISKEGRTISIDIDNDLIRCNVYSSDFDKTIKSLEKNLDGKIDPLVEEEIKLCISLNWLKLSDTQEIINYENVPSDREETYVTRSNMPYEHWQSTLHDKLNILRNTVNENFPTLWEPLIFTISIQKILNIKDCTLPFAGVLLGPPSSLKSVCIELFRKSPRSFYSDNFSPRSFVSHSTSVKREELINIDLLPKIRNRLFCTPELSPTFSKKDDDLVEILGIVTRVLDGHGYESDSGAHGHRGYNEDIMFTWIGAAVDIPHKVHKYLATLGPKLYFLRLPKVEKTDEQYLEHIRNDNFVMKFKSIQNVLIEFLDWFEQCPNVTMESGIAKIFWNDSGDDNSALTILIQLAKLLSHLRSVVPTWETKNSQGTDYAYSIPIIEEPERAMTQLRNLARGHALSNGRNYITPEDLPLLVKVVLSTASIERVRIFELLIANHGTLTTSQITTALNTTNPTARRTMTELKALGLVTMDQTEPENYNSEKIITLVDKFAWFLTEDFFKLKDSELTRKDE